MPITIDEELDAELERILGDRLLFDLTEPQRYGGPCRVAIVVPHAPGRPDQIHQTAASCRS